MKYVLLMLTNPSESAAMSNEQFKQVMGKHDGLRTELLESGELLNGAGMVEPHRTVRRVLDQGKPITTDVPETESMLHVSSYYVVECKSRERAVEIADAILDFHVEAVEIREVHDFIGM